jgi:Domain of unknown function (DUF5666)
MKILALLIALLALAGTTASAHDNNEHVRGVVTAIAPQSLTVETTAKATRTLKITDKTTFTRLGKAARLTDLKVGDRVVVDVPAKSTDALLIQIGTASGPAPKTAATTARPAK